MKFIAALSIAILSGPIAAQTPSSPEGQNVVAVEKLVVAALNFEQGDLHSLKNSQVNFTPAAWGQFMKTMQGFVDANGAATFTSQFVPAGHTVLLTSKISSVCKHFS